MAYGQDGPALMSAECLDESRLLRFLDGTISDDARRSVEAHIARCSACEELTTWAAADQAGRSRSLGREGRPFVGQLAPGSRVDRYQILDAVGRGGMGEVYAAYHPDLDRKIALKVVHEAGADSAERRARLLREARAIARLSHPNVVTVHDAGTVDGRVYIAMEFVDGETVDVWLRSQSRSWREVVDVFIAAARGLAAAHAAGIVHRDFKPQNVMIGRDGTVRVMDFGLARLADEPLDLPDAAAESDQARVAATVTKTGALVGTVAYMAPEQFRGETIDARADQFSFCVALYEALSGIRPALAHLGSNELYAARLGASIPSWLRALISRGLAARPQERFASMDDLIRALAKGRARPTRHALALSISVAVMAVAAGGWRVARGGHIDCTIPTSRLEGIWSGHDDSRRQSIHRAFTSSGRATAETTWQRVSAALDDYVREWSSMYVETCEATHVRGEQSAEVLDLRMACLAENLDDVKALTRVLSNADVNATAHAVGAAQSLPSIKRCSDVALLRARTPLPHDERTLESVRRLRASMKEVEALRDLADFQAALRKATGLRPQVEAVGYPPLLAEFLELTAYLDPNVEDPRAAQANMEQALFIAEAAHDDATAARATTDLVYVVGVLRGRLAEAETWFHLSESKLDRLGTGYERTRSWLFTNFSGVLNLAGDLERAERYAKSAIGLKETALGRDHPDVAISLVGLASILTEEGRPVDALPAVERALEIFEKHGDPDSDIFARAQDTKGIALIALDRAVEAEKAFRAELTIYRTYFASHDRLASFPLQGIGDARLLQGQPAAAVPFLEDVLRFRERGEPYAHLVAETRFSLAQALWDSGRDRVRALRLARQARQGLADHKFRRREQLVVEWLARHKVVR